MTTPQDDTVTDRVKRIRELVERQAGDDGCWFQSSRRWIVNMRSAAENTARILGCKHERCPKATLCDQRCAEQGKSWLEMEEDRKDYLYPSRR